MPFRSSGRGAYGPQGQRVLKGPLAPVWVTSGALSNGNIGASYSVQLSATDDSGDAPTYTLASGSLPSGLSLSSSGLISGTIGGSAGTFTFTVNATDINGRATTSSSLSITTISPELYTFSSVTFTSNGTTGRTGPSVSTLRAGAGSPSWGASYINQKFSGMVQWTVPANGTYQFTVAGASSPKPSNTGTESGRGRVIRGNVTLTKDQLIHIVIGQKGDVSGNSYEAGGAGASAVFTDVGSLGSLTTSNLLFIAGGGAGSSAAQGTNSAQDATYSFTTDGTGNTGAGNGGNSGQALYGATYAGSGGGGFNSNGANSNNNDGTAFGGLSLKNGFAGGYGPNGWGGGFGGGGYARGNSYAGAGGGGGYSGGRSGDSNGNTAGGGGCYIGASVSSAQDLGLTARDVHGYVTVTKL